MDEGGRLPLKYWLALKFGEYGIGPLHHVHVGHTAMKGPNQMIRRKL